MLRDLLWDEVEGGWEEVSFEMVCFCGRRRSFLWLLRRVFFVLVLCWRITRVVVEVVMGCERVFSLASMS